MANEIKLVYASEVTLEASGASAASNAYVAANDTSLSSANHSNYPYADFVLVASFSAAVGAGAYVGLYRQEMLVDQAGNSAPTPGLTYEFRNVGIFPITSGQSASAAYFCPDIPVSRTCQFSLKNVTGKNLTAGWVLTATPKSVAPT